MTLSADLARSSWSRGPFNASPVLLAGIRMASVTIAELRAAMPLGLGSIIVAPDYELGARLLAAFPRGTDISRSGASFDVCLPAHPGTFTYPYYEADTLPLIDLPDLRLPDTIIEALPGRRLSCLVSSTFAALREVDPVIEAAEGDWIHGTTYCHLTLVRDRIEVDEAQSLSVI